MSSWIAPSSGGYSGQGEPSTPPGPPPKYPAPVTRQTPPTPAHEDPPPLDPDCLAGKHRACLGRAWDYEEDDEVDCQCGCHQVTNVVASL